jgi:hypothetical protein
MGAMGMAEATDIDTGLSWHLSSNHYPPVPQSMIESAKQAITAFNEGETDRDIPLPDGIRRRDGQQHAPAYELVSSLHLDAWIDSEDAFS